MKHGHAKRGCLTKTYRIWHGMQQRCSNPKAFMYPRYGGRGIKVCWPDFEAFLKDMGEAPPGLEIDRINNDGNYEPGNCRWATKAQQRRNASDTRLIEFKGETLCLTDWATKLGITKRALWHRLESGWPLAEALSSEHFENGSVRKTHCKNGHAFDESNTYYKPNVNERVCRTCRAERSK